MVSVFFPAFVSYESEFQNKQTRRMHTNRSKQKQQYDRVVARKSFVLALFFLYVWNYVFPGSTDLDATAGVREDQ